MSLAFICIITPILASTVLSYRKKKDWLTSPAPVLDLKPLEVSLGHMRLNEHLHTRRRRRKTGSSNSYLRSHAVPLIPFLLKLRFFSLLFLVIAQLVLVTKFFSWRMSTAITYEWQWVKKKGAYHGGELLLPLPLPLLLLFQAAQNWKSRKGRDRTQRGGPKRKTPLYLNPNPYSAPLSLLTVRSPFCSLIDRRSYPLT